MDNSSRSLFIKKIDLVRPNSDKTTISPYSPARDCQAKCNPVCQAKCKPVRPPGRAERRYCPRDRLIGPVPVPPKRTTFYEEQLRQAQLARFESRDRRLKEFQLNKKMFFERRKIENERKRQQFIENRERVKREETERLLERDRRRREERMFERPNVRDIRQRILGRHTKGDSVPFGKTDNVKLQKRPQKGSQNSSDSTISLYGVDREKLLEPNAEMDSQKFRIHLPPNKMQKSTRPRNQPYPGGKSMKERMTFDRGAGPSGPSKRIDREVQEQTDSNFSKYSYKGSTAMSRLKKAEKEASHKKEKKGISYKLSHSMLYAPGKLPVRHKKSCTCGNLMASSPKKCDHRNPFDRLQTNEWLSSKRAAHEDTDILTCAPNTSNAQEDHDQKGPNDGVEDICSFSTATSVVQASESKSSTKSASCSRKTPPEENAPPDSTERGTSANTISITSKHIQSNPIHRTETSIATPNPSGSEEVQRSDDYSETFLCEETSLTDLMSDSDDAQLNTIDNKNAAPTGRNQVHRETKNMTTSTDDKVAEQEEAIEEITRSDQHINQPNQEYPDVVYMPCYYDPRLYSFSTDHNRQDQYVIIDPSVQSQTPHPFERFDQPTYIQVDMPAQEQYVFVEATPAEVGSFYLNQHNPVFSCQPHLPPEMNVLVGNESCDEIIVVCEPVRYSTDTVPIGAYSCKTSGLNASSQDSQHNASQIKSRKDQLLNFDEVGSKTSKDSRKSSVNGQVDASSLGFNIGQVDCSFKDQVSRPYGKEEFISKDIDLHHSNRTRSLQRQSTKQNDSSQKPHRKDQKLSKLNRSHCKKELPSPEKSFFDAYPGTDTCQSIEIVIRTHLMDNESMASPKETSKCMEAEYYSREVQERSSIQDIDYLRGFKDLILMAEGQEVSRLDLSIDQPESKSEPLGHRFHEGSNTSQKSSNDQQVNFSIPLGRTRSKRIQADVCCTYCSSKAKGLTNLHFWSEENQTGENLGQSKKDHITISTDGKQAHLKLAENDAAFQISQTYLRGFGKTSEFQSSSLVVFLPSPRLDSVEEEQYVLKEDNRDHLGRSHQYRPSGKENVKFQPKPSQKGRFGNNPDGHEKTPDRKAKITSKPKKTRLVHPKRRKTKKESSTVLGLYEKNQFSVVSLYRKASQLKNKWRSKLHEIKKRYSHLLTSISPSRTHGRCLNILLSDSANLLQANANARNPLTARNGRTIPCPGNKEKGLNNSSRAPSDHRNDEDEVLSCCCPLLHNVQESNKKVNLNDDTDSYAKAYWLVLPVSFQNVLKKVYNVARRALFKGNDVGSERYNPRENRAEPRQRCGLNHVPVYFNVQIQILIRSLAVLRQFQRAVDIVDGQIQKSPEFDSLIAHYLTCEISNQLNDMLEGIIQCFHNVTDHLIKNPQGSNRLRSENRFLKDVIQCLRILDTENLQNKSKKPKIDLPAEMRSVLDKLMEDFEAVVLQKLDEFCEDINRVPRKEVNTRQKVPIWLQDALRYLSSVEHLNFHDNKDDLDKCPMDIKILVSNLASDLTNESFG